jgi:hypothetical protein
MDVFMFHDENGGLWWQVRPDITIHGEFARQLPKIGQFSEGCCVRTQGRQM